MVDVRKVARRRLGRLQQARPSDERDLLTIKYTSGTTLRPKGVMVTHRNTYMNVVGTLIHPPMTSLIGISGRCGCSTKTAGRSRGRSPGRARLPAEARCRARLAHFKVARGFTFVRELPETATEKIQKFVLRDGRAAISAQ